MGKALFQSDRQNVDTASVRRWIGAWLQGMLDAGFVQTADTGQVDPETVEIDTGLQFAIFRFDDELQATHPVYFKVGFRTESTGVPSRRAIDLTVAKSTDGAGNLSGLLISESIIGNTSTNSSNGVASSAWEHLAASGDGWVVFNPFIRKVEVGSGQRLQSGFVIERARNSDGSLRPDALMVAFPTGNSATSNPSLIGVGGGDIGVHAIAYETGAVSMGIPPVITAYSIGGAVVGVGGSLAAGSIGPVFPWDLVAPGLAPWRSCVIVSIPAGDLPGGVFETNLCGQIGDFFPVAPNADSQSRWGIAFQVSESASAGSVSRHFGVGFRWED